MSNDTDRISGEKRVLSSILQPYEQKILKYWVPQVPSFIQTYHLTSFTLLFSCLAIGIGYLAQTNKILLILNSLLVIFQYVSDILDGAVGRYRKTGLVRWGFYMDHFFDYLFASSLTISYAVAYRFPFEITVISLLIVAGYFIHELLMTEAFGRLNTSGYYGFGPTELRLTVIVIGFVLPFVPFDFVLISVKTFGIIAGAFFIQLIYRSQKKLWKMDMKAKDD